MRKMYEKRIRTMKKYANMIFDYYNGMIFKGSQS